MSYSPMKSELTSAYAENLSHTAVSILIFHLIFNNNKHHVSFLEQHIPGVRLVIGQPCAARLLNGVWVRGTFYDYGYDDNLALIEEFDTKTPMAVRAETVKILQQRHRDVPARNVQCMLSRGRPLPLGMLNVQGKFYFTGKIVNDKHVVEDIAWKHPGDSDDHLRNYLFCLLRGLDSGKQSDAEIDAEHVHVAPCGNNTDNL